MLVCNQHTVECEKKCWLRLQRRSPKQAAEILLCIHFLFKYSYMLTCIRLHSKDVAADQADWFIASQCKL